MILYHAISVYQIMCCIAHRMEAHRNDRCILVLPDFIRTKFENYRDLETEKIFDEIYLFPYADIKHEKATVFDSVEKAYKETIPYPIEAFERVVNAGMHFYFSLYLLKHEKCFDVFEDSAGVLSRGNALGESIRCSNETFYEIMEENGLFTADNTCIQKCYCNFKAQQEAFYHPKAVDFDLSEKLEKLGKETIDQLLKIFKCPENIKTDNPEALILTQHFSNLNQMEFEEQVLLYQIITDYFLENKKLIFKPHPDDITYYGRLFPEARVIREKFPSELLPYIFSEMPTQLVSVSSTGSHLIKGLFKENLLFTFDYETGFRDTHKYYIALRVLKYLNCNTFFVCGADFNLLTNFINSNPEFIGMSTEGKGGAVLADKFTDEPDLRKLREENDVIVFLNTEKDFGFLEESEEDVINNIVPVVIRKRCIRETDNYNLKEEEVIYVYCGSKERYSKMKMFEAHKELEHVGDVIEVNPQSDMEIRVKVLEGILEATEKRMLYYKEKCERLESEGEKS